MQTPQPTPPSKEEEENITNGLSNGISILYIKYVFFFFKDTISLIDEIREVKTSNTYWCITKQLSNWRLNRIGYNE